MRLFLLLIVSLLPFIGNAQLKFRHWDESRGLPNDQIRFISTLDDRRIALRTPAGLMLFDGQEFTDHRLDRSK